ncbi:MAG: VCBS repeat-containing protein [Kiritimatiellae bacterium]|nr:VCBS repeat-containing protein [Kiritimatiellia bacterium]
MNRILTTATAVSVAIYLAASVMCPAAISVQWRASNGINDPTTQGSGADLPRGSLVELYYSPSANYANAVLLAREYTTEPGTFNFGPREFGTGTQYEGGYVFIKVYNRPTASYRNAVLISRYSDMSVTPLPSADTPVTVDVAGLTLMAMTYQRNFAAGANVYGDYDGDGLMDIIMYNQATGAWIVSLSGGGYQTIGGVFGGPGFLPVPGDYNGDRVTELYVYEQATGHWIAQNFADESFQLGGPSYAPVQGDYDGDGNTDPSVYQEASGQWGFLSSINQYDLVYGYFGGPGHKAIPADYDGDGFTDPAVYEASSGDWALLLSGNNYAEVTSGTFGGPGYRAIPADYDGDGPADLALYQESTGAWIILLSTTGYVEMAGVIFGGPGFLPVPADYDGDSLVDPAIYQNATGLWEVLLSSQDYLLAAIYLGGTGYTPVSSGW